MAPILDRVNVDTDQIIPKQFLKRIERTGFGQFLFFDWRFDDGRRPSSVSSEPAPVPGRNILLAQQLRLRLRPGSTPRGPCWTTVSVCDRAALPDIFYNNCFKNGILPITLDQDVVNDLFRRVEGSGGYR